MPRRPRRQIKRSGDHRLPIIDVDEHVIDLITYHRVLERAEIWPRPRRCRLSRGAYEKTFGSKRSWR
jgi:hypothetical protein